MAHYLKHDQPAPYTIQSAYPGQPGDYLIGSMIHQAPEPQCRTSSNAAYYTL